MTPPASTAGIEADGTAHEAGGESDQFVYHALPMRVVFGAGRLDALPDEVARLG